MADRDLQRRQVEALEGITMQLEWANAMMAEFCYELRMLELIMMCAEGDTPGTPDYDKVMDRADHFREIFKSEYHPGVK